MPSKVRFKTIRILSSNFNADCLQRKSYDESKCTYYIDQLYACCATFYRAQQHDYRTSRPANSSLDEPNDDDNDPFGLPKEDDFVLKRTVSCPIPSLLQFKIRQRMQDRGVDAKLLDVVNKKD